MKSSDPGHLAQERLVAGAADLRGFSYALEPLRRQRGWQLEQQRLQLARARQQLNEEEQVLSRQKQKHAQSSHAVLSAASLRLEPGVHARSLAYLTQLQKDMTIQAETIRTLRAQYEKAQQAYFQAHKNLEALDRHRDLALLEHTAECLRMQALEADRDWLARRSITHANPPGTASSQEAWS